MGHTFGETSVRAAEMLPLFSTPECEAPGSRPWGEDASALPSARARCLWLATAGVPPVQSRERQV